MNRYFFDVTKRVLAIVDPDGKTTFHNGPGFKVGEAKSNMTQEQIIEILLGFGYLESSPV